jgi:hypothetical protein
MGGTPDGFAGRSLMSRMTALVGGLAVGLALGVVQVAEAAAPARGCAPPFTLLTFEQQVDLAMQLSGLNRTDAITQLVQPTIDAFDHNGDTSLCFTFPNKVRGVPNVVDNVAAMG